MANGQDREKQRLAKSNFELKNDFSSAKLEEKELTKTHSFYSKAALSFSCDQSRDLELQQLEWLQIPLVDPLRNQP